MRSRLLLTAVFTLLCLPLFLLEADQERLVSQAVQAQLSGLQLPRESAEDAVDLVDDSVQLELLWATSPQQLESHRDALRSALRIPLEVELPYDAEGGFFPIRIGTGERTARLKVATEDGLLLFLDESGDTLHQAQLGSRLSLLPPLIAIFLAFLTRRTLLSLTLGVLAGAVVATAGHGGPSAFFLLLYDILFERILGDLFHLHILGFVILLSSTVAVITRMGGIDGMVQSLLRFAKSSRSVQAVAYGLGLGIFFDDYANIIVVGNSCGPLFDRQRISRAKLAYIVDSTAAPVAGVAILSTWVAYQISTFAPQLPTIGLSSDLGYSLFLETIPYRFYCLLAILTVATIIFLQRDFGPMLKVERRAAAGKGGQDDTAIDDQRVAAKPGIPARARNGILPLATMILGTAALIYFYGAQAVQAAAAAGDAGMQEAIDHGGTTWLRAVLGQSDSTKAIFVGSLAALIVAGVLALGQRLLTPMETVSSATAGIRQLFKDAVLVLLLAWSIGQVCGEVSTANYLVAIFQDMMSARWLPVLLFVTACFIAFATGSSWTTMAILQPNVVLLAWQLGEASPDFTGMSLLVLSIGSVLEGAIFGDHCSPISDTTVLSSTASRCRHIEHVRTQAPYALVTAAVAIFLAYLPVALLGASPWLCLAIGAATLFLIVRLFGRPRLEAAATG